MPTTVVKTIGSSGGRDYSTLQAWEDAAPANLVTADQVWQGQCYNDSEFFSLGGSTFLNISGSTSDATRYKELTVAAGQSFQDAAGVRSNALQYNVANGVGIRGVLLSNVPIAMGEDYCRINRIQLLLNENNYSQLLITTGASAGGMILKDCILDALNPDATFGILAFDATNTAIPNQLINVSAYIRGTGGNGAYIGRGTAIACNWIRTSSNTAAGIGILGGNDTCALVNCAIFGFVTPAAAIGTFVTTNCKNNATDQSSGLPGSGQQYSVTYNSTTPFVLSSANGTGGTYDLRAAAATALNTHGTFVSTANFDISLTTRATNPTIGAWELTTAVTTTDPPFYVQRVNIPLHWIRSIVYQ